MNFHLTTIRGLWLLLPSSRSGFRNIHGVLKLTTVRNQGIRLSSALSKRNIALKRAHAGMFTTKHSICTYLIVINTICDFTKVFRDPSVLADAICSQAAHPCKLPSSVLGLRVVRQPAPFAFYFEESGDEGANIFNMAAAPLFSFYRQFKISIAWYLVSQYFWSSSWFVQ